MALEQTLDRLDGDNKKRAHDFVSHIVNDLRRAVQASDIQKVRDIADELERHRDMVAESITGAADQHKAAPGADPNKSQSGTSPPHHRDSRA